MKIEILKARIILLISSFLPPSYQIRFGETNLLESAMEYCYYFFNLENVKIIIMRIFFIIIIIIIIFPLIG